MRAIKNLITRQEESHSDFSIEGQALVFSFKDVRVILMHVVIQWAFEDLGKEHPWQKRAYRDRWAWKQSRLVFTDGDEFCPFPETPRILAVEAVLKELRRLEAVQLEQRAKVLLNTEGLN